MTLTIEADDALALQVKRIIQSGAVNDLRRLLAERPELASAQILGRRPGGVRTPLHVVTDWPGQFPNGPETVRVLLAAGAEVDARTSPDKGGETPLHWAASSDDVEVAEALIDAGADIEAPEGSIGSPLDNAIGYGCWFVARLLVQRGARVDRLWHAAALGLLARTEELLAGEPPPRTEQVSQAFWHACSGGQRRTAELLLAHGADINFVPEYVRDMTPLGAATSVETRRTTLADWLRGRGAR